MHTNFRLNTPRLRDGVSLQYHDADNYVVLNYREQTCDLEFPVAALADIKILLNALQQGSVPIKKLEHQCHTLKTAVIGIINELDRNGLITESYWPELDGCISGKQLYRQLQLLFEQIKQQTAASSFYNLLHNQQASRSQLIGYAMEYYQLVKLAPGLIAPALAKAETKHTRVVLQDFLRSELYHDKMLEASLLSVGISDNSLEKVQPLASTFAICASLGVYAYQHPLSFKAALFIFEKPYPEFNAAFKANCLRLKLSEQFYEPILRHSKINEESGHDDISRLLLEDIPAISPEEQITVKKHLVILVETLLLQEREILASYAGQTVFKPRIFE